MTGTEYQNTAYKFCPPQLKKSFDFPALGMMEELGEVMQIIRKSRRDNTPMWRDEIQEELGDLLWNIAVFAKMFDINLNDLMKSNITKLTIREKERNGMSKVQS